MTPQMDTQRNPEDWDVVLHFFRHLAPMPSWWYDIYCLGDGFGRHSEAVMLSINEGYDWSHIRDSSAAAVTEMADEIRRRS
jgi:hypothetical protein